MSENSIPEGFKMTEFGHLPKVWEVVRFGDKGQFQYGYTTSATDENTGTKFLRITDIKEDGIVNWGTVPYGSIDDNNLQKFRLSKGDILFARIGATTGKTCIIGEVIPNAVFASYLIRFVPDKELHPIYVFYFTQTREYQELVNAGKEGKLKKGLSATELKNFNIPLPPLPEQRAIAKVLSTVQGAKEKTETVIEATKELKKSMMKHLFSYGPVPVKKFNEFDEFNELRVNEFDEFNELGVDVLQNAQNSKNSKNSSNSSNLKNSINLKKTKIGLVPEEWDIAKLGEKGHFQYGYTTSATEEDTGTKFLRITDITEDGFVNWGTVPYGCIENENIQKFKLSEGDILFARIGATTGKTCIIGGATPHAIFASYLIRFVSNEELYSKYVFYFTQTRKYQELVNSGKEGKLKKGLSATELKNFKIPLPPITAQQKIASILSTVDKKIEAEETKKKTLDELFNSILHNLMTGKVRVNHIEVML